MRSMVSMGLAGTAVVLLAVAFSLTFLPALLAILGRRVDALRLPYLHPDQSALSQRAWQWLAAAVMAHPWRVLVPVVIGLILVGSPFCGSASQAATSASCRHRGIPSWRVHT
jgi:RND superfamily putative drug exporter